MSGDSIKIKRITAYVQENGIIRLENTGQYIGRIDDTCTTFEQIVSETRKTVVVDADELEHLLNCLDNQKFVTEHPHTSLQETQAIIDAANHKMRMHLIEHTK